MKTKSIKKLINGTTLKEFIIKSMFAGTKTLI